MSRSSSSSKKQTTNNTTNTNTHFAGDGNVSLVRSSGNTISVTDHGAISDAFDFGSEALDFGRDVNKVAFNQVEKVTDDAFDFGRELSANAVSAFEKSSNTISSALKTVDANSKETVSALKEFATTLTVGDIESSKFIALSIIGAVAMVLVVYFWVGRK